MSKMPTAETFTSMEQIEKRFFPNAYEKKRMAEIEKDPKELGKELARQAIEELKRRLPKDWRIRVIKQKSN